MLRDPFYGIYSETLLGHRLRCTQEDCTGWMVSNGFLRFERTMPPEHGWAIEYECSECGTIAPMRERDKLPLVREILRPLFEG
jgi:hypothetical protein